MKSTDLANILAPFAILANKHAMSATYKTLEVAVDTIRGCSPWGVLEVDAEIGTKETFWIETAQLIGVVKTLPAAEITFKQSGSTLSWKCENEKGELALLGKLDIPTYEWEDLGNANNVPKEFPDALQLGSLSASRDMGLSSAGVSGVALTWMDGALVIASSDNTTISVCSTPIDGKDYWPVNIVISTEAAQMLSMILQRSAGSKDKKAQLDIQEKVIIAYADDYRLMIRSAPPMKRDIYELSLDYISDNIKARLPRDAVKQFIARATVLSEAKAHAHVKMLAENGTIALSFEEGASTSSAQYALADLANVPENFPEVRLDAMRLARALAHADMIALDTLDKGVIRIFGEKPDFSYLVNGTKEKKGD